MYDVTVSGATIEEVAEKMRAFADNVLGGATEKPAPTRRTTKPKTTAEIAKEMPGETIVSADDDDSQAGADTEPTEEELKVLKETHAKALEVLRVMYAKGKEGQKAVARVAKAFSVKKLGDVPVKDADKLMAEVEKEQAKLPSGAEDAPI